MNACQNLLLNSFINEGTRKVVGDMFKTGSKGWRNVEKNEQTEAKLAKLVNIHRARLSCIPQDAICISMNKNHVHCSWCPTIYRAAKWLKDRERLR